MALSEFRYPALSRKEFDNTIEDDSIPDYAPQPLPRVEYPVVKTAVDTLMVTQSAPRHSVTVRAGAEVEIISSVFNDEYRAHVIRYQEAPGEYVYCVIGEHLVGAV